MNLLPDDVVRAAGQAQGLYHRLVLLVAPSGSGKTAILKSVAQTQKLPFLNVNLEVSSRMLDITGRQRAIRAGKVLREIVDGTQGSPVLLDNIEILFDQALKQDPLRLLKDVARSHTVVAAWNGTVDDHGLSYAQPDHPEYQHYPPSEIDFLYLTDRGTHQ